MTCRKFLHFFLLFSLSLTLFCVITGATIFWRVAKSLPEPTPALMLAAPQSTLILDRNGELLYEAHGDIKRIHVPLSDIPTYLRDATIAIEDKNFYRHYGFDPIAMLRAAIVNHRYQEARQGASTITQQLSRVAFLNNEKSFARKLKELVLAIQIERRYTKDEILEMYLNNIPYGSNAYGAEAASNIYFGKSVRDLSLLECAYLAALPKAPSFYSPYGPHSDLLYERAQSVIQRMQTLGYIPDTVAAAALKSGKLTLARVPTPIQAPHFVFYVLDQLEQDYGKDRLRQGGWTIYTSLDLGLQTEAEKIITEQGIANEKKYQANNAALVALDPRTGEILAMVGSRDYFKPGDGAVNVALSLRQPGSSFKPYVYATAFANGLNPATMLLDVPTDFANSNNGVSYTPHNYNNRNYGPISVRQALAGSLNVPAVKTLLLTGIDKSIDTAEKLGLSTLKDRKRFGPSLVLGGAEVKLLEHTAGLGAFGNAGVKQDLSPIMKIIDSHHQIIFEKTLATGTQAVDPQIAYLINDILSDKEARRFIFGSGKNLTLAERKVAVKTGTTQDFRDAWTIGYTPSLAVGVWVGNNDNSPMKKGADGSVVAAPIWKEFLAKALSNKPLENFTRPKGIVELSVDKTSGKLPSKYTPNIKKEIFASFNVPRDRDNIHFATATSGPTTFATRFRSEKPDDPLWENGVQRWIEANKIITPKQAASSSIAVNTQILSSLFK